MPRWTNSQVRFVGLLPSHSYNACADDRSTDGTCVCAPGSGQSFVNGRCECPSGNPVDAKGVCCGFPLTVEDGKCVPFCEGGQTRAADGSCKWLVLPSYHLHTTELTRRHASSPPNSVFNSLERKCIVCPPGSTVVGAFSSPHPLTLADLSVLRRRLFDEDVSCRRLANGQWRMSSSRLRRSEHDLRGRLRSSVWIRTSSKQLRLSMVSPSFPPSFRTTLFPLPFLYRLRPFSPALFVDRGD